MVPGNVTVPTYQDGVQTVAVDEENDRATEEHIVDIEESILEHGANNDMRGVPILVRKKGSEGRVMCPHRIHNAMHATGLSN